MSRKEADGVYGLVSSMDINGGPKAMTAQATIPPWYSTGTSISQEADESNMAWLGPHGYLYMETSWMACKIMPITHPYLSHMERHPKILEDTKK